MTQIATDSAAKHKIKVVFSPYHLLKTAFQLLFY